LKAYILKLSIYRVEKSGLGAGGSQDLGSWPNLSATLRRVLADEDTLLSFEIIKLSSKRANHI
jgi:hypothetical protein